jgi:hypothetical protein
MAVVDDRFAKVRTLVGNPRKYFIIPSICALTVLAFCFQYLLNKAG